jgi:hypothetical protein
MRFVFRDSYTTDLERSDKSKNRLSALYLDYKSVSGGYGVRLGRQSPTGGGVMGRFDGVSGNVILRPKLKLSAVAGEPTDKFFESRPTACCRVSAPASTRSSRPSTARSTVVPSAWTCATSRTVPRSSRNSTTTR